jgi:hypothetical protein
MPLEGSSSSLSRPPDFVLLNAVPGVDDDAEACYLGDGPSDMVSTLPGEVAEVVGRSWSADEVRRLFLESRLPAGIGATEGKELRSIVQAFWDDIDGCYEDSWERGALPAEKRWVCEEAVARLTGGAEAEE